MSLALPAALAFIAFLYALVGHGGASGYIALLTLTGHPHSEIRSTALLLNLCVSGIATVQFARAGSFRWSLFWPFVLTSVPAAWLGAQCTIDALWYKRILALCLMIAAARLLIPLRSEFNQRRPFSIAMALLIGVALGFISGLIGIGGGILLSPLLLLLQWAGPKETAAVSAPFILVNSAAGLVAITASATAWPAIPVHWIMLSIAGGIAGSWAGAKRLAPVWLNRVLGVVLTFASVKLVLT